MLGLWWALILAVIFVVVNGITQMYLAKGLGYKLKPTGLAYFVGVLGNLFTGSVVPISGQAETLTLSGKIKDLPTRVAALLIAAAVGIIMGLTGSTSKIAEFAGSTAVAGMMAGVGFILAGVGWSMCKQETRTGVVSMAVAYAIYMTTHDLVYTIAGSVAISTLDFCLLQGRRVDLQKLEIETGSTPESDEWRFWKKAYWMDFKLLKPKFGWAAVMGGLSFICLNIGSNISFGNITSSIAGQTPKLDSLTWINSLADVPSILFGGAPIEAIISGTAGVPSLGIVNGPWLAGIIMMALSGILLITGLVGKLGKYIPAQSIAGFLFIIGLNITVLPNLATVAGALVQVTEAFDANIVGFLAGGTACAITVISENAFVGLATGALIYNIPVLAPMLFHLFA